MNGVGLQEPAIEKKPAGVHGLNLSALAVRERSVTLFFLLAIIIAGAVAYLTLGRAEDPTFTIKIFTVTAAWPGATAQEMQDVVAEPLEKRMQELKYYYYVDTFTRPGLAFLTVRLRDYTTTRLPTRLPKSSIRAEKRFRMRPQGCQREF